MTPPQRSTTGSVGSLPTVTYVINSLDRGGAEAGLVALVEGGLFANCRLKIVALARGEGGVYDALIARGYAPEFLSDRVRMRMRDLPGIFLRLWRSIRRERPDVVIASLPQANLLARLCLAFRRRTTFVSFEHNTHLAKPAYEAGFRLTSWRVDWTFADAHSTLRVASERLYRRRPCRQTVVPLVSFASPAQRTYSRDATKPFHVVNAGRFTTVKNQAALVEAVAILVKRGCDLLLTLYGEGVERDRCKALAESLGIQSRVRFPGFIGDWHARPADLFALASRHEGVCIVALQAMHAGIPVVTPIVGGLRDYAAPDVVHVLHSLDPRSIADTIARAMEHEHSTRGIVERAAAMVDERYGVHAVRSVYREVNRALIQSVGEFADGRRLRLTTE